MALQLSTYYTALILPHGGYTFSNLRDDGIPC